jgi:hypothetical protein
MRLEKANYMQLNELLLNPGPRSGTKFQTAEEGTHHARVERLNV